MPSARCIPFRLRKNSECVSRTFRLSSSTRVRGPLAQTQLSAASSSIPQRGQARTRRQGAIFIFQQERPAPGHRKRPSRPPNGRSQRWSTTWKRSGYSVAGWPMRLRRRTEKQGAPPEVALQEAESPYLIGEMRLRLRLLRGKGPIQERQLRSCCQSTKPNALCLRPGQLPPWLSNSPPRASLDFPSPRLLVLASRPFPPGRNCHY